MLLADSCDSGTSMVRSGITREELESWGGPEVFNQGLALCNSGDVHDVVYDDDKLSISGKISQRGGYDMCVSFRLERGTRIHSDCPCMKNQRYGMVCEHVLAIGIAQWVGEAEEDELNRRKQERVACEEEQRRIKEEHDLIEVPMAPRFYALLSGSRASLSIELDAWYGDVNFPACSIQSERTVYLPDPNDDLVRRTRSLAAEKSAVTELKKWGFEPGYQKGDLKLYLVDPQGVLNFLGAGYPKFRRRAEWKIDMSPRLLDLYDSFRTVVPVVKVKDAADGAFDVSYSFEAQDEALPAAEVQAALNRQEGAILRNGQVFLLDGDAIEKMHDIFRDCAATQGGAAPGWFRVRGVYAPYVRNSLESILDAVDLDDSGAAKWRETAEKRGNPDARFEPVSIGPLETVLRPYQKQGVYWLRFLEEAGLSGLLADEMGLGKTLQTLTWLSLPRTGATKDSSKPALIVCPTSLVRNWEAEAQKFTPWLRTIVISGPERNRLFASVDGADLIITSYALLQRDFDAAYLGREFSTVVLDEAQHIKNRDTKNAKAVKLLRTSSRLVLTGTPIENSVADVWSIFDFLMPGYLGDYESFRLGYEDPIREGGENAEEPLLRLKRKLEPFILRRLKKSVAKDLPDKIIKVSYCPMDEESQREYSLALAQTKMKAGEMVRAKGFAKSKFEILALLMKLRQIAARAKKDSFLEQLDVALSGGHKILVFSQFVSMLTMLRAELDARDIRYCYLDGSTKERLAECNRFNRTPEIQVFLISLLAGGTGLNLTGADMVMHYDPWWNPAVENQATDRAHRIGQKKSVLVMKMIASGSIEEKVLELQHRKQAVINATISTTDAQIFENLTAADINSLLQ